MGNITKTLRVQTVEYYSTHLSIINCLLPVKLTNKEIEVLSLFMCYSETLNEPKFGRKIKKLVREKLDLSHQGISNYIASLIEKKMLIVHKDELSIIPILKPNMNEQIYMIKLVNIEEFNVM